MTLSTEEENTVHLLKEEADAAGQYHLFEFWDKLDFEEKNKLIQSISKYRLLEIKEKFNNALQKMDNNKIPYKLEPVPSLNTQVVKNTSKEKLQEWRERGLRAITESKLAVVLLAGGQGTRLGSDLPKGMFDIGLPSKKTLFQIQAERIKRVQFLSGGFLIPFYIMTSPKTHEETKKYFEKNNFFDLNPSNVYFFSQHTLPCFSFEGKILLESRTSIAEAPDGNGGLFKALETSGALDDMKKRGICYLHVYCVDNVLVRVADPCFLGYSISSRVSCAVKVVTKSSPLEKIGVICKINGKFGAVEYSEIQEGDAYARDPEGELLYNAGNICNHYFTLQFVERMVRECELPLHVARKSIPHVDSHGDVLLPKEPNGLKLEMFIFDALEFSDDLAVYLVERSEEFSPLKNASGSAESTPEHCRKDYLSLCERYLTRAGAKVDKAQSDECEVSPLTSYAGENLEGYNNKSFNCWATTAALDLGLKVYVFNPYLVKSGAFSTLKERLPSPSAEGVVRPEASISVLAKKLKLIGGVNLDDYSLWYD
ncbi:UDP-N-acetylhexosamine pyrophosphorylase-like protein 1 [Zophobas morio]|uniref:UDP-N-acetylhexosamine pyrophosphorylase-like protein 1 n=1 Tax=Zophobas morio TaxID=2755281 RepID=UPI003083ACBE